MTREEREQAIVYLETSFVAESNTDGGWSTHHNNVIRTAIKALSQEPCDDAISRQAYIERYRKWCYSEFGRKIDNEALAIRVAMSLPPVTPQPKTGHWIKYPHSEIVVCNQCKGIRRDCRVEYTNYCNRCGAKMVEPQESEGKE